MQLLRQTTWGSREGADSNDNDRMRLLTEQERRDMLEARDKMFTEKTFHFPPSPTHDIKRHDFTNAYASLSSTLH